LQTPSGTRRVGVPNSSALLFHSMLTKASPRVAGGKKRGPMSMPRRLTHSPPDVIWYTKRPSPYTTAPANATRMGGVGVKTESRRLKLLLRKDILYASVPARTTNGSRGMTARPRTRPMPRATTLESRVDGLMAQRRPPD
jgi:hypothetical protein